MIGSATGHVGVLAVAAAILVAAPMPSRSQDDPNAFRVCADPNNLPFSDRQEAGFENKLAELIANQLGQTVNYTWWPQRRGFIRNTLDAGECDVVMGLPVKIDGVEETRPYYRSSYVFVSRAERAYHITSIKDARLRDLSIGVQLIGEHGINTPPVEALTRQGISANLVGYSVFGDYSRSTPPAKIIEAVSSGAVDIAAAWGPLAGYFASQSPVPLTVVPITETESFAPLQFEYDIAIAVRKGEPSRKAKIEHVLANRQAEIRSLLDEYHVPLVSSGSSLN